MQWWSWLKGRWNHWQDKRWRIPSEEIILYTRPQGAVCYAVYLLGHRVPLERFPDQLLTSELGWYWESQRDRLGKPEFGFLPDRTSLTRLTEQTKPRLLQELSEVDVDDYGRSFVFYGCSFNKGMGLGLKEKQWAVEQFLQEGSGVISLMIVMIGDDEKTYLYVPREPIESVRKLLANWGILSYSKVRPFRDIENLLDYFSFSE